MEKRYSLLLAMLFVLFIGSFFAREAVAEQNADVKAAISGYIEAKTTGGLYRVGNVAMSFDYVHSGVSKKGGLYVSCADFNKSDTVYDVDFYLRKEGGEYVVVKEVLHKRDGKKLNRLLWIKK